MAVAMSGGQLDVGWMGPWGYIISKPDLKVDKFPDDTKGRSISFADVGSTSGWLIPTYYAKEVWKIEPKKYWTYADYCQQFRELPGRCDRLIRREAHLPRHPVTTQMIAPSEHPSTDCYLGPAPLRDGHAGSKLNREQ